MSSTAPLMKTPMKRVRGLGSARSGTEHFWRQRLTAIANIPLTIGLICVVFATIGKDAATAHAVLARPYDAFIVGLFAISGSIHMALGMRIIIEDYIHTEATKISLIILNTLFSIAVAAASVFAVLHLTLGA